jgi:glutathione synthase/RimK-type ligase-like ATP-grasp enzyme
VGFSVPDRSRLSCLVIDSDRTGGSVTRLAVATADTHPTLYADDLPLAAALVARGIEVSPTVWDDPGVDWGSFDAVLVRSIWDYSERYPAYRRWLDALDAAGVPAINDTTTLRGNADKRYLAALGGSVVPTRLASHDALPEVVAETGGEVVVKPTVSAGARHTVRGTAGSIDFAALPAGLTYLVQPYLPEIETAGEWSLFFYGGAYSHAIRKVPAAGDYRVQIQHGGISTREDPSAEVISAAAGTLRAAAGIGFVDLAYARVDGVEAGGRFQLMELELIEPFLSFYLAPESVDTFADVVAERLRRRASARTATRSGVSP